MWRVTSVESYERRLKIINSIPVQFILYSVPFGVITESLTKPFSWEGAAIKGILFGAFMTFTSRARLRSESQSGKTSSPKQIARVHRAIQTGELPTESKELKAFPTLLEKRQENIEKAIKQGPPILIFIAALLCLLAILNRSLLTGIIASLFLIMGIMQYFMLRKMLTKINILRAKL